MSTLNNDTLRQLHKQCVNKGVFTAEMAEFDNYIARMKKIIRYYDRR